MAADRPHALGVDDAPFDKGQCEPVPIVGVMTEGPDLVECVALGAFAVDGDGATAYLAEWIGGLRCHASLQCVVLGGITIAGLGVVDVAELAERLERPVLVATRQQPDDAPLLRALGSAGLAERRAIVTRSPRAQRVGEGLFVAAAGIDPAAAARLAAATVGKSQLPEPLRVAHLIARALVTGESRGRA